MKIKLDLAAGPYSVEEDIMWSVSLSPDVVMAEVRLVFGPSVPEVPSPATLEVKTKGLDLPRMDPATIGLYFNMKDGPQELRESIDLDVDIQEKEIEGS